MVTGCKGSEVGKCGYQSYAERCELLIIRVHMTYISVIWLQTVYILVCVLCTVCSRADLINLAYFLSQGCLRKMCVIDYSGAYSSSVNTIL